METRVDKIMMWTMRGLFWSAAILAIGKTSGIKAIPSRLVGFLLLGCGVIYLFLIFRPIIGGKRQEHAAGKSKIIELCPQNHPELEEEEVFLGNTTPQDFYQEYSWDTKRAGVRAFDLNGNRVPNLVPVFVKRKELEARGFTLVEETKT